MARPSFRHLIVAALVASLAACAREARDSSSCRAESLRDSLVAWGNTIRTRNPAPGIGLALYAPGRWPVPVAAAVGVEDLGSGRPLTTESRFLAGSVGKTFFAALALRLAADGRLALDAPIAAYLPGAGLPAADSITVRHLLAHRAGYPEYDGPFIEALLRDPLRARDTADWFGAIRRGKRGPIGAFRYSDLNYVVLAAVLDAAAGRRAYDAIGDRFLVPLQLRATIPATSPDLPRLVTGYDGPAGLFGRDTLRAEGRLSYNPQFEWGGGGFASTPADLARWMAAFRLGEAFPESFWATVAARPADVPDTATSWRGLGIHVDRTARGLAFGHSGYIPGYLAWVRWYEDQHLAIAAMTNATDTARVRDDGFAWLDDVAGRVAAACGGDGAR